MKPSGVSNKGKYILLILMLLVINTCDKDEDELPFSFDYSTLDINSNKKNTFREGENIIFYFKITNHSNELYRFFPYNLGFSEIFKIYRRLENHQLEYVGRPAKYVTCHFGSAGVPAHGTLVIKVPLYDAELIGHSVCEPGDSMFLPSGNYESSFTYSFSFINNRTYNTDTLNFILNFEIIK